MPAAWAWRRADARIMMNADDEFFYRLESWSLIQERALADNRLSRTQGLLALKDRFEPVVTGNYLEATYLRGLRLIVGGIGGYSFERALRHEFLDAVQRIRYRAAVWRDLLLTARAPEESADVYEYAVRSLHPEGGDVYAESLERLAYMLARDHWPSAFELPAPFGTDPLCRSTYRRVRRARAGELVDLERQLSRRFARYIARFEQTAHFIFYGLITIRYSWNEDRTRRGFTRRRRWRHPLWAVPALYSLKPEKPREPEIPKDVSKEIVTALIGCDAETRAAISRHLPEAVVRRLAECAESLELDATLMRSTYFRFAMDFAFREWQLVLGPITARVFLQTTLGTIAQDYVPGVLAGKGDERLRKVLNARTEEHARQLQAAIEAEQVRQYEADQFMHLMREHPLTAARSFYAMLDLAPEVYALRLDAMGQAAVFLLNRSDEAASEIMRRLRPEMIRALVAAMSRPAFVDGGHAVDRFVAADFLDEPGLLSEEQRALLIEHFEYLNDPRNRFEPEYDALEATVSNEDGNSETTEVLAHPEIRIDDDIRSILEDLCLHRADETCEALMNLSSD